ncbi:Transcription initiation factor IID subunit [Pseudoloma neurophilia]|uniref:Transcription initiation factor TFIID subunit 13 n=1 Tax=Pseudoloma neurophilia TaxID=146866 RepID=A0A0R0M0Z8_9MICR|nr:Transcription initiation factor IID subunit [Pseudoloma neurophilia]
MREKKKISLIKDLRLMMYGFGDQKSPRKDTTEVLHSYLLAYLKTVLIKTQNIAKLKGKTKTDDLLYVIKKDRRKYLRVKDLLMTNEELKNARKSFNIEEFEKEN